MPPVPLCRGRLVNVCFTMMTANRCFWHSNSFNSSKLQTSYTLSTCVDFQPSGRRILVVETTPRARTNLMHQPFLEDIILCPEPNLLSKFFLVCHCCSFFGLKMEGNSEALQAYVGSCCESEGSAPGSCWSYVWTSMYADLEPRQGEPTQTTRDH